MSLSLWGLRTETEYTQLPPAPRRLLLTFAGDFFPAVSDSAIGAIPTAVRVISHVVGLESLLDIGPLPAVIAGVTGGPVPVFVSRPHGLVRHAGFGESLVVIAAKIIGRVARQVLDLNL